MITLQEDITESIPVAKDIIIHRGVEALAGILIATSLPNFTLPQSSVMENI